MAGRTMKHPEVQQQSLYVGIRHTWGEDELISVDKLPAYWLTGTAREEKILKCRKARKAREQKEFEERCADPKNCSCCGNEIGPTLGFPVQGGRICGRCADELYS